MCGSEGVEGRGAGEWGGRMGCWEASLDWQRQHVAFVVLTLYKHNHM